MKKQFFITLMAISMIGAAGCGQVSKAAEAESTQTVAVESEATSEEATTVDEDINNVAIICAEIEIINTNVISVAEDVANADSFEALKDAADKFSDLKNEYLSVMVDCGDEAKLADVKQQLFATTKAMPTSIKEDTDEEKSRFVEKSSKLVEAVNKISDSISSINK